MKVLYYLRALNIGGAETFIYNVLSTMNDRQIQIDIVVQEKEVKNIKLLDLCKRKGCNIFITTKFENNLIKSVLELNRIIKKNQYDAIHFHANSLINPVPIICAKLNDIKLIIHSHNSFNNLGGKIGCLIHKINRRILSYLDVTRIACSMEAGEWMFNGSPYNVFYNSIILSDFKFNNNYRNHIRNIYNIDKETILLGHVGRFVKAKNHEFLIKCFEEIHKINPNTALMLVGDGELFNHIKNEVEQNDKIKNYVFFVGSVQDTKKYYSAFDLFLFPSLFEGLPFVLVEGQASGLQIIASENVTKKVNISGLIHYVPLNRSHIEWAQLALSLASNKVDRLRYTLAMKGSIFDSSYLINEIQKVYRENNKY